MYTHKQIHEACLAAADHIEDNPHCLEFLEGSVPTHPLDVGCPAAWVSYFLGHKGMRELVPLFGRSQVDFEATLGVGFGEFMARMNKMHARVNHAKSYWTRSAPAAARCLRAYANTYHPVAPDWNKLIKAVWRGSAVAPGEVYVHE